MFGFGGTADKLVFPGESSDYYIDQVSLDSNTAVNESLQVYNPANNSSVYVAGHFGEYVLQTGTLDQQGKVEQLVFADGTFSTAEVLAQSLQVQSFDSSGSTTTSSVGEEAAQQASSEAPTAPPVPPGE